jgi:two-component system response regulator DesR
MTKVAERINREPLARRDFPHRWRLWRKKRTRQIAFPIIALDFRRDQPGGQQAELGQSHGKSNVGNLPCRTPAMGGIWFNSMIVEQRPIRVMCVDDNELIGDAIQIKLELMGGFDWLGQLYTADQLVDECLRRKPDVVLLDIDMPGEDPLEVLRKLTEFAPQVRVLMLTGHVRRDLIERAIESGAWGYLSKYTGGEAIVQAIRNVTRGEFVMGPGVAAAYRRR